MPTIDVQVHAYERNHPGRPWVGTLHGPAEMTGDQMVAAMDTVGVDAAVLVSPFSMYGYDPSYALEVGAKHPTKFCLVRPVDPNDPGVADTIADWAGKKGTVGVRIMMRDNVSTDPADPGVNRVLAAAGRHGLAVNLLCWGRLEQAGQMAARNPDTQIVIDHLGLQQPFEPPAPPNCWADLPKVTALAAHPNVAIKISGACTLSHETVPLQRHLGPARPHLRRVRVRALHVGHRLDPRGRVADLRAGGRGIPRHRPPVRQRQSRADGRHADQNLQVVAGVGLHSAPDTAPRDVTYHVPASHTPRQRPSGRA